MFTLLLAIIAIACLPVALGIVCTLISGVFEVIGLFFGMSWEIFKTAAILVPTLTVLFFVILGIAYGIANACNL